MTTPETKAPSKKSQAFVIFQTKMEDRKNGKFTTNKEFRAAVMTEIQEKLEVSVASAATMYNSAKQAAEEADASVNLGRDPKKEKVPSSGKRGRPAKNKEAEPVTAETAAEEPKKPAAKKKSAKVAKEVVINTAPVDETAEPAKV